MSARADADQIRPAVAWLDLSDAWTDPENDDRHELEAMLVASSGVLGRRVGFDVGNVRATRRSC